MKAFSKGKALLLLAGTILLSGLIVGGCAKPTPTATPETPTPELIKWRWQCAMPAADPTYHWLTVGAADLINKACKGRLEITTYQAGELCAPDDVLDSTKRGVFEMATTCPAYWMGVIPECAVAFCPYFQPNSLEACREVFWEPKWRLMDVFREAYKAQDVHLIDWTFEDHWTLITTKPVHTVDDFRGMKVRTFGLAADFFEKLGASPTSLPYGEIYMAMKLGTVDAATVSMVDMEGMKFMEVCDYVITPYLVENPVVDIFCNMDAWNALPDDLKATVEELILGRSRDSTAEFLRIADEGIEAAKAYGVEWIEVPEDQQAIMYKATAEVLDDFAEESPTSAKIVKIMTDYKEEKGLVPGE
jgi:TRAP-type mannitol/chloroaromatic compound transport system substrate-binding protein